MIIIQDALVCIGFDDGSGVDADDVSQVPIEEFEGARVDLDETEPKGGTLGSVAYLTVVIPLRDDAARTAAYRLRDHVRSVKEQAGS